MAYWGPVHGQPSGLRSNLRLRLVSALDGPSIRFDIVVRIASGPRPTAPAGPGRRGYPAGGNGRLELYPARRGLVLSRGLLFTQPGARNILQRAARPSREGVFP